MPQRVGDDEVPWLFGGRTDRRGWRKASRYRRGLGRVRWNVCEAGTKLSRPPVVPDLAWITTSAGIRRGWRGVAGWSPISRPRHHVYRPLTWPSGGAMVRPPSPI